MEISEQWLRQWVNTKKSTNELVEQLTLAGLEVDSVKPAAADFSGVVIGEVLECDRHPNADKLSVCTVNVGKEPYLNIVCGASNVRKGLKVAVAQVGAVLPGNFKIKKAKLRDVPSEGMLCASSELGLTEGDSGIMELSLDAPLGQDFRDYLQLDDVIIDIDLTPNRGDCASVMGVAREVSALNQTALLAKEIEAVDSSIKDTLPVEVQAVKACPRYLGRVIKNINSAATTPIWLSERLRRSGLRPIHPVVDIANYVMLELGQPLHAFDLSKISGGIQVRYAKKAESFTSLDGAELSLSEQDLVIADDAAALALAGVMGGLDSSVTSETKDIFLESAYFEAIGIAKTARLHKLSTDSSYRYERGVDFNLQINAIELFSKLALEVVGGDAGPIIHVADESSLPVIPVIELRQPRIARILGIDIDNREVERSLTGLGMTVAAKQGAWLVTPPSHRYDIRTEVDLIEELARLHGYANIPNATPTSVQTPIANVESRLPNDFIRQYFSDKGYFETLTYSFVDPKVEQLVAPNQKIRKLLNPISSEMSVMRTTIWTGLLQTLRYNQDRQQQQIRLFEMGLCFDETQGELVQTGKIAALLSGSRHPEQWADSTEAVDFYDLKGDVEILLAKADASSAIEFVSGEHPALHPAKTAALVRDQQIVGYLGELHPSLQQKLGIKTKVYLFEADLEAVCGGQIPKYQKFSKFPLIRRDIAVVVDEQIQVATILKAIVEHGGDLLQNSTVFDVYRGEGIETNKKSIAIALKFQHPDRTLVDDEINNVVDKIVAVLQKQLSAILRV